MGQNRRPRNAVLDFVEDSTLSQGQAAEILDISQPTVSNYLQEEKYSDHRTEKIVLDREAVLNLVQDGVLNQTQAGDVLGITQSAVAQALD